MNAHPQRNDLSAAAPFPARLIASTQRTWTRATQAIPESLVALLARFSIAAVFWNSGQTKVEGFTIDVVHGIYAFDWPSLADSTVDLFRDEYKVPLLAPHTAAVLATIAEHVLPLMLLLGFGTGVAALGLLFMTAVIQFFVYPGAYPMHGTWAAVLLWLIVRGPGRVSIDWWLARRMSAH